jgi:hypothetical protein
MTRALRVVQHAGRTGLRLELADRTIWKTVGGPLGDVPDIVQTLLSLGLLADRPPHLQLTRSGRQVATQDHQRGGRLLARQIINGGLLLNQARVLVESCEPDDAGALRCRRDLAISRAPQLTGLLRRFPEAEFGAHLVIPRELVSELDNAWIPAAPRSRVDHRKSLGDRGEEFSYRYERDNAADRTRIHWVAQHDDNLGYDIEDINESTRRLIEVKASAATDVRFFLSTNEWRVASENPAAYEVQFWGGLNLASDPAEEYQRLRASGYPIVFSCLPDQVQAGRLHLEASQYVITEALPAPGSDPAP